jgi:polyisoprenoid-binding protein YceI
MSQQAEARSDRAGAQTLSALAGDWTLDAGRAKVGIKTRSMWGLVGVKGHFNEISGGGTVSGSGDVGGTVRIATASLDTKNAKRDTHLRSADFFDAEQYPFIVFTATSATPAGEGVRVDGTLEVKGVVRPVQIPMSVAETTDRSVSLVGAIQIDRSDYGMDWNQMGMARMTNEISFEITFVR